MTYKSTALKVSTLRGVIMTRRVSPRRCNLTLILDRSCKEWYSPRMNRLSPRDRGQILGMMVEGVSIRSITRLTGASKNTVAKLLVDAGTACLEYQDATLRNLTSKRLQCDEIWSFVYA